MKNKAPCFFRFLIPLIACVICAVLLGAALMTAVYMIPTDKIEENVALSAEFLKTEGAYYNVFPWCSSELDNFTDSIMLNEAAYNTDNAAIVEAMLSKYGGIKGGGPYEGFIKHYADGVPFTTEITYSRYWHGYLVFLKPFLFFADYTVFRAVNLLVQLFVCAMLVILMAKNNLKKYIIPFLIAYAFIMPLVVAKSLQFSSCYYIMTVSCIALLALKSKLSEKAVYIFLTSGIATAFFDFLTYPIATFGVPAVIYFCLLEKKPIKENLWAFIKIIFAWGIGYCGMWAGKWIIGSFITGQNIVLNALGSVVSRTSSADVILETNVTRKISLIDTWKSVIKSFLQTPVTAMAGVFVLSLVIMIIVNHFKGNTFILKNVIETSVPFIVLVILPFLWYAFTQNHSSIHAWFAHKGLIVTAFAGMCMLVRVYTGQKGFAKHAQLK